VRFYHTIVRLYQTDHRASYAILEEFPCFRAVLAVGWIPCGASMAPAGRLRGQFNAIMPTRSTPGIHKASGLAEGVEPRPPLVPPCAHTLRRPENEREFALLRKRVRPTGGKGRTKPHQSQLQANRKPSQSHTKATPKPYQSHTKAIPKPYQSHTKAIRKPPKALGASLSGAGDKVVAWASRLRVLATSRRQRRQGSRGGTPSLTRRRDARATLSLALGAGPPVAGLLPISAGLLPGDQA
jgi:hypothetical protein